MRSEEKLAKAALFEREAIALHQRSRAAETLPASIVLRFRAL